METREQAMFLNDAYRILDEAEQSVQDGDLKDGFESLEKTIDYFVTIEFREWISCQVLMKM